LIGDEQNNWFWTYEGDDYIEPLGGFDYIDAGPGQDWIIY